MVFRRKTISARHEHTHDHRQRRDPKSLRSLKIALALTSTYMLAEAIGGWLTNSLALLADAGHMLTDVAALVLTLMAIWFASRPATPNKTFGYYRLEILAAFVNGIALVLLSLWVIYEAYERWQESPEILGLGLTIVAFGGLVINLIAAWLLHGNHKDDLNMRGAWLHVMGDALGSVAAIVAGVVIIAFGWLWADAVVSVLISLIIIWGAWRLIRESVNVLLEGTPAHINLTAVEESILQMDSINEVHDLHVWTITSGIEALSVHIVHKDSITQPELLQQVRNKIHDDFDINHLTIQLETPADNQDDSHDCFSGVNCFEPIRQSRAKS